MSQDGASSEDIDPSDEEVRLIYLFNVVVEFKFPQRGVRNGMRGGAYALVAKRDAEASFSDFTGFLVL